MKQHKPQESTSEQKSSDEDMIEPEEKGGRQQEKSLDTRHRRFKRNIAFYRGQKTAVLVVVCLHDPRTVCSFNACPSEKAFSVMPNTGIGQSMNGDEYSLQQSADSV
ncbi:hypothetical protein TNCV_4544421 [Trichonephila clavipes]|nr:hypothetical protein TNCV_4544421 [Trichonephila clavipes]